MAKSIYFRNRKRRNQIKKEILEIYVESNRIYSAPKITAVLYSRGFPVAEKTVSKQKFSVDAPNKAWVTDITYSWTYYWYII